MRSLGRVLAAALVAAPFAAAQGRATFETSVEFVRLSVTATRGAHFVTELDAADLQVLEDGVAQKLEVFNRRSAPLSLVLLLDTSGSMKEPLQRLQEAASHFVAALGPEDSVQVAQLTSRLTVLQDFTADKARLAAAVLQTRPAGTTALYNALYASIRTLRDHKAGDDDTRRQAIVVLSDGVDNASLVNDDQVLDLARRNEVALYAIGLDPSLEQKAEATPSLELLRSLAFETGGRLILPKRGLREACAEIAEELRHQYTLGYASTNPARNGQWRRIEIRTRRGQGDLELRHRLGYYAAGGRGAVARVVAAPAGASPAPAGPVLGEWMSVADGVLELKLARRQGSQEVAGVLRADTTGRELRWSPALPGAAPIAVPFDAVTAVAATAQGGFVVALGGESLELRPGPADAGRADARFAVASLLEALGRAPSASEATRQAFFGVPVAVAIVDLLSSPGDYEGRAVSFSGEFESVSEARGLYALRDGRSRLEIHPASALGAWVAAHARAWTGQRLSVSAVFRRQSVTPEAPGPVYRARVFEVIPPATAEAGTPVLGRPVTLQELRTANGALDGALVRAIGRFRGRNLYRDLAPATQAGDKDWVLRDGSHSVWVTGAPPSGQGFKLDPLASADTLQWLAVVGRPVTREGVVSLAAVSVALVAPPAEARQVTSRAQGKGYEEPVVTFALPDTGERIAPDTQFVIQFSAPMDPTSLQGRVVLEYDPPVPGSHDLEGVTVGYSEETRHVVVEPRRPLRRGRALRCRLLPGIVDVSGRPLNPRDASGDAGDAIEVLRFRVE